MRPRTTVHWKDIDSAQSGDLTRSGQDGHVLRHPGWRRGPSHRRHVGLDHGRGDDRHEPVRRQHRRQQGRDGRGHSTYGPVGNRRQGRQLVLADRRARRRSAGDREGPGALRARLGGHRRDRRAATDYTISEPEPLGALASVDPTLVTVTNGQTDKVAVTNQYDATPPEPVPAGAAGPTAAAAAARSAPAAARPRPRARGLAGRRRGPGGQRTHLPARQPGGRCGLGHRPGPQPRPVARRTGRRARDPAGRPAPPQPGGPDPRRDADHPRDLGVHEHAAGALRRRRRWPSAPRRWSASGRGCSRAGAFQSVVVATSLTPDPTRPTTRRLRPRRHAPGRTSRSPSTRRRSRGVGEPVVVPRRGAGHGQRRRRVRALLPPPARAPAHDLGAGDVPLPRARVPRRLAPRARAARRVHRARDPGLERRRAHAARCWRRPRRPDARPAAGSDRIAVIAQTFAGTG